MKIKTWHVFLAGLAVFMAIGFVMQGPYGMGSMLSEYLIYGGIGYVIFLGLNKITKRKNISIVIAVILAVSLRLLMYFVNHFRIPNV